MKKFNRKGVTLAELIITLGIFALVLSIAYPFFISNFKFITKSKSEIEYQSEGQKALDKIVNIAMESKGIFDVKLVNNSEEGSYAIKNIAFIINGDNENDSYTVEFQLKKGRLYCEGKEVAKGIKYIEAIPSNKNIQWPEEKSNVIGVRLIIKLENNKRLETEVYFRNKN